MPFEVSAKVGFAGKIQLVREFRNRQLCGLQEELYFQYKNFPDAPPRWEINHFGTFFAGIFSNETGTPILLPDNPPAYKPNRIGSQTGI
jgi:hypothetical protein